MSFTHFDFSLKQFLSGEKKYELRGFPQKAAFQSIVEWSTGVFQFVAPVGGARNPSAVIPCAEWLSLSYAPLWCYFGAAGLGAKFMKKDGSMLYEFNFCVSFLGASCMTGFDFGASGSWKMKLSK